MRHFLVSRGCAVRASVRVPQPPMSRPLRCWVSWVRGGNSKYSLSCTEMFCQSDNRLACGVSTVWIDAPCNDCNNKADAGDQFFWASSCESARYLPPRPAQAAAEDWVTGGGQGRPGGWAELTPVSFKLWVETEWDTDTSRPEQEDASLETTRLRVIRDQSCCDQRVESPVICIEKWLE